MPESSIHLQPGEAVTCVFTNTVLPGTIIIENLTYSGTERIHVDHSSGFTDTIKAPNAFELDSENNNLKVFKDLRPKTYIVTEKDPSPLGYSLTDLNPYFPYG